MPYILPLLIMAAVPMLPSLLTLIFRQRLLHGHVLLCSALLLVSFVLFVMYIVLDGAMQHIFVYNFIFEVCAIFCAPIYYIAICSLTEPRGTTLSQRRIFFLPILFGVVLIVAAFCAGHQTYDDICYATCSGDNLQPFADTFESSFLLLWNFYVFHALLVVFSLSLSIAACVQLRRFINRYEMLYSSADFSFFRRLMNGISTLSILCVLIVLVLIALLLFHPPYFNEALLVVASVLCVDLTAIGILVAFLRSDAATLSLISKTTSQE